MGKERFEFIGGNMKIISTSFLLLVFFMITSCYTVLDTQYDENTNTLFVGGNKAAGFGFLHECIKAENGSWACEPIDYK